VFGIIVFLVLIVLVFFTLRLVTDIPNIASGTLPDEQAFEHRYARYPWLAYGHIVPGVVYLVLAPIQLWRGFRDRHLRWHRRIGRVAITAGLMSGVFGIAFGLFFAFGGPSEAAAAVVFGTWFVTCLVTAYRAIRRRDVRTHRRWMIRAFAVGLAVGTIRIWVGLFEGFGIVEFRDGFGLAFWLGWLMHVAAAELWLWWRPEATGKPRPVARPEAGAGSSAAG
jgi:uncharacterized membrane protein YozB (DUF420 family)